MVTLLAPLCAPTNTVSRGRRSDLVAARTKLLPRVEPPYPLRRQRGAGQSGRRSGHEAPTTRATGASSCPTSPACPGRCQQAETATGSKPGTPPRERLDQLLDLAWIRGMGRWHAAVGRPRLNSYPVGVAAPSSPPWHSPYPEEGCALRWGGRLPPSRSAFSTPVAGRSAAAPTLQRGAVSAVTARRARGRGWPRLHGGCAQARRPSAQCGGGSGRVCVGCSPRSLALEPLARSASPPPTR